MLMELILLTPAGVLINISVPKLSLFYLSTGYAQTKSPIACILTLVNLNAIEALSLIW